MTKVATEQNYQKTQLDNGIRVVSERIPHLRSVTIGAWVVVGSRDENEINNGISHFVEHMVFKGTTNRTAAEIAESLESVGGHLNAFTGKELTCYYSHVLDEHLPKAIEVISDMLANSLYDEIELEKEKRVVLEELNAIEETPEELVHEIFWRGLFPKHPLGFPIIGTKEVISKLSKKDLVNYVTRNYSGNRIVIVAAGNVDHDELVRLTAENFAPSEQKVMATSYRKPQLPKAETKIVENGAIQAHICLGTHAFNYEDMRKYDLLVLNTLLGSGMSSRLFQNIREKHGLAYSVYSFVDFMFDTGMFAVYIGTDGEKIEQSIELILGELNQLREKLVDSSELERTKSQLKGNLVLGLESTSSRMNRLAKMEIYLESFFSVDYTIREIEKVSAARLQETANLLFDKDRIYSTILKPQSSTGKEGSQ